MESAGILSSESPIKLEQLHHEIKLEPDDDDEEEEDDDVADAEAEKHARDAEQRAREAEQRAREAEQRMLEAEQRAIEAEQRAIEAEKNAAHERRLRGNYYNQQCRIKKDWSRQKVQLRIEISGLKAQIWDLKNDEQKAIKAHRDEMQKKDELILSSENDLNLFEAMIAERDRTIQRNESDYRALLDDLISAKITIEDLKSAI